MLLEREGIVRYLNGSTITSKKGKVKVIADVYITHKKQFQIKAFDMKGYVYIADQGVEKEPYSIISKRRDARGIEYIYERFKRSEKALYYALEYMEHTENELNEMKEEVKFIAAAYINAYTESGALLKKSSSVLRSLEASGEIASLDVIDIQEAIESLESLESLDILDVLEALSSLFNITKELILHSQKLYNDHHDEHFKLLEIYKRLSRSYGINKLPYIVVIDEHKHRDSVYLLNAIKHTASRYEGIKECEEVYNYYNSRATELKQSYKK